MNRQDAKVAKDSGVVEPSAELDDLAHRVIGAAIEVHRFLGPGFLESVYEEALCVEFALRGIRFARQVPVSVRYKGEPVGEARLDLLVDDSLVVELEAVESIAPNVSVLQRGIKRVVQTQRKLGALGVLAVRPL